MATRAQRRPSTADSGRRRRAGTDSKAPGETVAAQWLRDHLGDPDLRVVHVSRDRRTYPRQHVEGAAFCNLDDEIAPSDGRPPDPDRVTASLRRWRVGEGDRVVLYDDRGHDRWAGLARLLLLAYAQPADRCHVLQGGLESWKKSGGTTTADIPEPDLADGLRRPPTLEEPDEGALATYREAAAAVET